MIPQDAPHEWSQELLLNKAQSYAEEMLSFAHDDWRYALWSTLSLELLARAALCSISPTLMADVKSSWDHLLYALDIQPKTANFAPRAIDISEVFRRLQELIPDFTPELEAFCKRHMSKRNEELHSGASPFVGTNVVSWIPTYYRACEVILGSMEDSLHRFFGSAEAVAAEAMITAAKDESAKSIRKEISAHKVVWDNNLPEEQERLALQSSTWAIRQIGHRVSCPACNCIAILSGSAIAPPLKSITEDGIAETQEYLPSRFECVACRLKISGLSQLSAAGLGNPYNATFTYDVNFYAPEDHYGDYEPDFNEPDFNEPGSNEP